MNTLPTVGEFTRAAAAKLAALVRPVIGSAPSASSPRLDAEVLVMHACGLNRAELITRADTPLCQTACVRLDEFLQRRLAGEPIAYITGKREFWSLELLITPAVLIPRPETELLVERALVHIPANAEWTIADIGTGSGAIALALAKERPRSRVIATDASAAALDVARENTARHGLKNVEFRRGEWLAPLAGTEIDLLVSNPPYLRADDPHLDQSDVRFEPRAALVAGADGLDAIRVIVRDGQALLRPGGWLLVEHGYDQGSTVRELLQRSEYQAVQTLRDIANQDRATEAHR